MNENQTISLTILGKTYQLKCAPEEIPILQQAADAVALKIREIQATGKPLNNEQLAVLVALSISHERQLQKHQESDHLTEMKRRIQALQQRIENAVAS